MRATSVRPRRNLRARRAASPRTQQPPRPRIASGWLAVALGAAPIFAAAPIARADDPHDCELFKNNSGEVLDNTETAVDHMQQASRDQGREAAQDAASAIVYFRQAGDAAKLLATSLHAASARAAATKLDGSLHAQADAFEGTIKGQGSQASQDKLKAATSDLKVAIHDYQQAVRSACGS
ncbi:hypothetical protein [Segniliparus rotundus]|nr:hypothetical protein [Segniliparus rotundus]